MRDLRYVKIDIADNGDKVAATVLIRGAGDVASAVGVALARGGLRVALNEDALPSTTRRGMAFADAVFDGVAVLEGLSACRVETPDGLRRVLDDGGIPFAFGCLEQFSNVEAWSVIVDARMRKRAVPECQRGLAPVTIGLGPNFVAGENVDLAVETSWGNRLGTVVTSGATLALQGEPQAIGGAARERFVYAPIAGRFESSRCIADRVEEDDIVATIAGAALRAPFRGILRGLTHDGVDIAAGTKVVEVDPRNDPAAAFGLGARPRRIAEGVLAALKSTASVAFR